MGAENRRRFVESMTSRIRNLSERTRGVQITEAEGAILQRELDSLKNNITVITRLPDDSE